MKNLLFALALVYVGCSTSKVFVVENETVTNRYWKWYPDSSAKAIYDTILQVHDLKGKRRIFYDYPDYTAEDWLPVRLKMGDTINFDVKHNYLKGIWQYHFYRDECGKLWSGWQEPNYYHPSISSCKCK